MEYQDKKQLLMHQISILTERIHYAENRRRDYILIASALIAAGVAFLTWDKTRLEMIQHYIFIGISLYLILFGIGIFLIYSKQTNCYPFTSATSNKKWFYRDALKNEEAFNVQLFDCFSKKRQKIARKKISEEFSTQYDYYNENINHILTQEHLDIEADKNQIYILHINEKYKNLYLSHLKQFTTGGIILLIILTSFAFIGSTIETQLRHPHESKISIYEEINNYRNLQSQIITNKYQFLWNE